MYEIVFRHHSLISDIKISKKTYIGSESIQSLPYDSGIESLGHNVIKNIVSTYLTDVRPTLKGWE